MIFALYQKKIIFKDQYAKRLIPLIVDLIEIFRCNKNKNYYLFALTKKVDFSRCFLGSLSRYGDQKWPFLRFWEKEKPCKCCLSTTYRVLLYSEPGSNRYGHYCPQDFKSGVSTYSTIRATQSPKRRGKCTILFLFYQTLSHELRIFIFCEHHPTHTQDHFVVRSRKMWCIAKETIQG